MGLLWLVRAESYGMVLAAVSLHGVGGGLLVPNAAAPLLSQLPPRWRARGVGVFTACLYLGQFASPLLVAALAGATQAIPAAIDRYAIALLVLAAVWLLLARRQNHHQPITA